MVECQPYISSPTESTSRFSTQMIKAHAPDRPHNGKGVHATRKRRKGGTLVEFAVVIPIFLVFVLGLIEVGRAFMASHVLTNAARVGCRQGVLTSQSTTTITSTVSTFLQNQGITGTTITVKVNGVVADASSASSNDDITVTVSAPV